MQQLEERLQTADQKILESEVICNTDGPSDPVDDETKVIVCHLEERLKLAEQTHQMFMENLLGRLETAEQRIRELESELYVARSLALSKEGVSYWDNLYRCQ